MFQGRYGSSATLGASTCSGPCSAGYFCPAASTAPNTPANACPAGRWGASTSNTNSTCDGACVTGKNNSSSLLCDTCVNRFSIVSVLFARRLLRLSFCTTNSSLQRHLSCRCVVCCSLFSLSLLTYCCFAARRLLRQCARFDGQHVLGAMHGGLLLQAIINHFSIFVSSIRLFVL